MSIIGALDEVGLFPCEKGNSAAISSGPPTLAPCDDICNSVASSPLTSLFSACTRSMWRPKRSVSIRSGIDRVDPNAP